MPVCQDFFFLFFSFIGLFACLAPFFTGARCLYNFPGKWKILPGKSVRLLAKLIIDLERKR